MGPRLLTFTVRGDMSDSRQIGSAVEQAYANLTTPLDVAALLPDNLGKWPVSLPMANWLAAAIHSLRRSSVLEFGPGWSSLIIAEALAANGGGRLTSIEHQPQYVRPDVWHRVQQKSSVDAVLVVTELRRTLSTHGLLWTYRGLRRRIRSRAPFDLVFIDAPPSPQYGRIATVHDAYPFLAPGAVIILDDAARAQERTAVARWLATYPSLQLVVLDVAAGRGIGVLVHEGTPRRRLEIRAAAATFLDYWRELRRTDRR